MHRENLLSLYKGPRTGRARGGENLLLPYHRRAQKASGGRRRKKLKFFEKTA
ncbi:hypothetical protein SUBVAR_06923 [Subdoligranulum variabile DSM 15176]|uniref:Uncharacterized protein n=1 Tax=Subdoligranulum variabile DSM 15176 TaxID=411471 RepID=D1PR93_9FIRM|nr:hypothetical protein SUBVAR_06923 [Subdoligranulum variabile DSM 15176]